MLKRHDYIWNETFTIDMKLYRKWQNCVIDISGGHVICATEDLLANISLSIEIDGKTTKRPIETTWLDTLNYDSGAFRFHPVCAYDDEKLRNRSLETNAKVEVVI